ncbi:MAG TPA: helix-turn-helix transcriptional regulator, partial [Candidatus Merdibacter merdigallinarum]|nr:helix-turn-helix transcriptional regulator [Candidatus Merdibacter merdigallinarum]
FMPVLAAPAAASAFLSIVTAIPVVLLTHIARPVLDRVRTGAPADVVELLHPSAFLRPSHGLFVCVLLFSVAAGYAMCLGEVENAPAGTSAFAFVLLAAVVYAFAVKGEHQEDLLFSFSVVLVMAGFLTVPVTLGADSTASNLLIDLGENCFEVLLWLMFASIGRRNLFAMLPTFGFAEFCASVGTDIGAIAGHASNVLVHGDERMVMFFALMLAFVLFAFLWLGFRRFSFTEVVSGVEPVSAWANPRAGFVGDSPIGFLGREEIRRGDRGLPSTTSDSGNADEAESMQAGDDSTESMARRCADLAESHGLTEREREIFGMLARGRNARFIMEEFVLSRNTVKSHIKHIYGKLGVHSQQELIDMVEGK